MGRAGSLLMCGLTALVLALSLAPLFAVTYPPLQDVPNHLARIVVLTAPPDHAIHAFYEARWGVIPNLTVDLILIALAKVMSLAMASKLVVALCMAGWVVSPLVLHFAVYRKLSAVPLVAALFLFNQTLRLGLLNFLLGSSLVVLAVALWILLERRPLATRLAIALASAVFLFFTHLLIFAIFALAVGIWELFLPRHARKTPLAHSVVLLAGVALTGALLYLVGPHETFSNNPPSYFVDRFWPDFFGSKIGKMANFVHAQPIGGLFFLVLLAGVAVWNARTAKTRADGRLGLICLALFGLYLIMPSAMMDGLNMDWRILAPLILFIAASLTIKLGRVTATVAAAGFVLLLGWQTASNFRLWVAGERNYRDFASATAALPEGSRLYHGLIDIREGVLRAAPPILHLPDLAVLERGAAVVSLFAMPTQQPIRLRDGLRHRFASVGAGSLPTTDDVKWPLIREHFDYVLLASLEPVTTPPDIVEVGAAGLFHLYRVDRPAAP